MSYMQVVYVPFDHFYSIMFKNNIAVIRIFDLAIHHISGVTNFTFDYHINWLITDYFINGFWC